MVQSHFPDLIDNSRKIPRSASREHLIKTYLMTIGACPTNESNRLFKWKENEFEHSIKILLNKNEIVQTKLFAGDEREWLAIKQFIA